MAKHTKTGDLRSYIEHNKECSVISVSRKITLEVPTEKAPDFNKPRF